MSRLSLFPRLLVFVAVFALVLVGAGSRVAHGWVDVREDTFGYFDNKELDSNFYYCDDVDRRPCRDTEGSILPQVYDRNTEAIPRRVKDADSLYKFLHDEVYYNEGIDQHEIQKSMVAFLVNSMMGVHPDEASRVLTRDNWDEFYARLTLPGVEVTREVYSSTNNVYHQGKERDGNVRSRNSAQDAAWLDDDGMSGSAIVITYNGSIVYAMHTVCANPDGSLATSLPELEEQAFEINPKASVSLSPDDENPDRAIFNTGADVTIASSASVDVEFDRSYFIRNGAIEIPLDPPQPQSPHTRNVSSSFTDYDPEERSLVNFSAVNEVCVRVSVSPASGTIRGSLVNVTNPQKTIENCASLTTKPYHKVYGGDVLAGAAFPVDGMCGKRVPSFSAHLIGWHNETGATPHAGAGTQLAAFAYGTIMKFATSQYASGGNYSYSRLAFAQYNVDEPAGHYGGMLHAAGSSCAPDFWAGARNVRRSGPQTIDHTLLSLGETVEYYVDGADVYITNNIEYQPTDFYDSISAIPSFRLIVRGGNIYVGPGVTELNGLFVAIPDSGSGGTFYTCSNGNSNDPGPPTQAELDGACRTNPLTVYGAVAANRIKLNRTYGSVRHAQPGTDETWRHGGQPAEKFIYTPEVWLRSSFRPTQADDAIRSLPPVLL